MLHHTTEPAERAADIADHEAKVNPERDCDGWPRFWLDVYYQSLQELCWREAAEESPLT